MHITHRDVAYGCKTRFSRACAESKGLLPTACPFLPHCCVRYPCSECVMHARRVLQEHSGHRQKCKLAHLTTLRARQALQTTMGSHMVLIGASRFTSGAAA